MRYVFGDYVLDTDCFELRRAGTLLPLGPKAFELLTYLLQHRSHAVTKEELIEQVWPNQFVSESVLTSCILLVRKALGDSGRGQQIIKTVHGRGYRFIASVEERLNGGADVEALLPPDMLRHTEEQSLDRADVVSPPASGQPVQSSALPPVPATSSGLRTIGQTRPEAERRQLTVLACRLVSMPEIGTPLTPEELLEVVRDYQEMCTEVIHRFAGHIAQYQGTGLVVHFGYPWAHEDDARRAVHTGLGLVEGTAGLNRRLKRDGGVRLAVRVGIHTGVVVSVMGRDDTREPLTLGDTPIMAAQLQDLAAPDTVVISPTTLRLVEGYFITRALGTHILDDTAEPLVGYQILQESTTQSRLEVAVSKGLTPLVGRDQEVGLLLERWEQARDGTGQVVLLSGEAGIGKSRLVQVLKERLTGEVYARVECHCSPYYQNTAFYPLAEHLRRFLRLRREAPPHETLSQLEEALASYGFVLPDVVPLFAALLSLSLPERYAPLSLMPQQQKRQTQEAILTWLLKEAERQPVCFVVEDLHWADPSTLEFCGLLLDQVPTIRALVLLLFRPEFRLSWTSRSHLTQITLGRLTRRQVETMIDRITGGKPLPVEVRRQLVDKTDGVPLFIEELTKMVLESGLLKETEGQYKLPGSLRPLAIPATLHDSLMARLDRLGRAKQVAQLGATLGREFAYELLQAVAPMEEATLQQELARLVDAELLYQRGLPPQVRYVFKHALIQEAAYQSLLKSTRQQYHHHIAQVLEARFPEIREAHPELAARHYTEAGLPAQALPYWRQAAQQAMERSGYREAVACFEQALTALQHLPEHRDTLEQAIDVRLALRTALQALGEFGRIHEHLRTADTLAQTLADHGRQGWVAAYQSAHSFNTGAPEQALKAGRRALALAQGCGDTALEVVSTYFVGLATLARGHYPQAVTMLGERLEGLTLERPHEFFGLPGPVAVLARAWAVWGFAEQGAFAEGLAWGHEGLRLAEAAAHPFALASAAEGLGVVYLRQGALPQAIAVLERGLHLCQDWHLSLRVSSLTAFLGYAYTLAERTADALPLLEQAVGLAAAMHRQFYQPLWMVFLSEAYLQAGRWEAAAPLAEQALALARAQQESGTEAWVLRLCGELAAQGASQAGVPAEVWYRQALAQAEALGMRPLLAHCHLGLGTLYSKLGQSEQARIELAAAIELYRVMEMTFWLPRAEVILTQVKDQSKVSPQGCE